MPRNAREKSPTGIYHVILRGVNRQSIFQEVEDRQKLTETLARYKVTGHYKIFAYCLMDNHIHLLLQENEEPIGEAMKRIGSSYVSWFNKKYGRCGHLFQERFKSEVVDSDRYFLTVLRYIHQNPVKAKMVTNISDYRWSSYGEYTGKGIIVDKEYVLEMFGKMPEEALQRFEKFSKAENTDFCLEVEESKTNMSDEGLRETIGEQFGIDAINVGDESRDRQNSIFRELKQIEGVSIRQIARTTGVSQTRIWRA